MDSNSLLSTYNEIKDLSFLERWRRGIAESTQLQQSQASQKGNWVMLVGLIVGIIVMAFKIKEYWWIEIILFAALFNHTLMMLGIWQKIKALENIEKLIKGGEDNV